MAKYTIKRSCGHTETIQIYGKVSERDGKAAWEEGKLCYECYKAAQVAKHAAENQSAAQAAETAGLPALSGSEKQVSWAQTIRIKMIEEANKIEEKSVAMLDRIKIGDIPPGATEDRINTAVAELQGNIAAVKKLKETSSAKWFIDNRMDSINQIIINLRG